MSATTTMPHPDLVRGIQALAGVCDYAHSQDGQGFNGTDANFGHALALVPAEAWTPGNCRTAWELLRKYRRQLTAFGIDYTAIPEPIDTGDRAIRAIDWDTDHYVVRFTYDPAVVASIRAVPGARWNRDGKVWAVPASSRDALLEWAAREDFTVSDTAREEHEVPADAAPIVNGTVRMLGDVIAIEFPYNPAILEDVRGIVGRVWVPNRKVWTCPATSIRQVREVAERHALTLTPEVEALPDAEVDLRPRVAVEAGDFTLTFPYDRDLIAAVRDLPGARWSPGRRAWCVDLSASIEVAEWAQKFDAAVDGSAGDVLASAADALRAIEESAAHDAELEVPGLGGDLMPFQRAGVAYALRTRRTFIADEMGLGKTVQAIATLHAADAFPAVIVCPASLKINWEREINRWVPGRTVEIVGGTRPHPVTADIVIINYDVLDSWADTFTGLRGLVLDESHYVKNGKALRAKAALKVAKSVDKDGVVLCLTGTPVLNNPTELVTQLRVLDRLAEFGGARGFRSLYGYGRNLVSLNRRLRATCFVRRRKSDVLTELPPKRWATVTVPGDTAVMAEYRTAEKQLITYLADRARSLALEQGADEVEAHAAGWQAAMRAQAAEHLVAINTLKRLAARAKMTAAQEWLTDFTATGSKIVVFGWHTEVVDTIADQFATGTKIQGGQSTDTRQAAVDRFQADDTQKVIACQIKAAGVGLTLTAASDVLFIEQGWTPADMDQAVDRCHRIGQQDSVTGWNLLCDGTIDMDIAAIIEQKRLVVDAATDGHGADEDGTTVLGDLLVRLAERGLAS